MARRKIHGIRRSKKPHLGCGTIFVIILILAIFGGVSSIFSDGAHVDKTTIAQQIQKPVSVAGSSITTAPTSSGINRTQNVSSDRNDSYSISFPLPKVADKGSSISITTFEPTKSPVPTNTPTPTPIPEISLLELSEIIGTEYASGSKGEEVKSIQKALIDLEYLPAGEADGQFGKKTAAAVSAYQKEKGIQINGKANIVTQYLLMKDVGLWKETSENILYGYDDFGLLLMNVGSFYLGSMENEHAYVKGTYYYPDGIYYAGEFEDNLRNGQGKSYFPNGDCYSGEWKNDVMEGKGIYHFGSEDSIERYDGNWENGTMTGEGTYYQADGSKITGTWKNNAHAGW